MRRKCVATSFAPFTSNACLHARREPHHFGWAVSASLVEESLVRRAQSWATPWGSAAAKGAAPLKRRRTEVLLCPSGKVGHHSLIFGIAAGMGALPHPKPSAQKMDILNFHFPFKCHLDLFFLSPTLFHINCVQLQGVSENITLA